MTGTRHRQPIYYEVVKFLQENPLRNGHECAPTYPLTPPVVDRRS